MSENCREAEGLGWRCMLTLLLAGAACALGAYVLLRIPTIRAAILSLTPHRENTEHTLIRQNLLPRSVAIAGMLAGAFGALGLLLPAVRKYLLQPLAPRTFVGASFVVAQALCAVAVLINLFWSYDRLYHALPGSLSDREMLSYLMPQSWPEAQELKRMLPLNARAAFRTTDERLSYQLASFTYPIALYEIFPRNPEQPYTDPEFERRARAKRLDALVEYSPSDQQNPLRVRPLQ